MLRDALCALLFASVLLGLTADWRGFGGLFVG